MSINHKESIKEAKLFGTGWKTLRISFFVDILSFLVTPGVKHYLIMEGPMTSVFGGSEAINPHILVKNMFGNKKKFFLQRKSGKETLQNVKPSWL